MKHSFWSSRKQQDRLYSRTILAQLQSRTDRLQRNSKNGSDVHIPAAYPFIFHLCSLMGLPLESAFEYLNVMISLHTKQVSYVSKLPGLCVTTPGKGKEGLTGSLCTAF